MSTRAAAYATCTALGALVIFFAAAWDVAAELRVIGAVVVALGALSAAVWWTRPGGRSPALVVGFAVVSLLGFALAVALFALGSGG